MKLFFIFSLYIISISTTYSNNIISNYVPSAKIVGTGILSYLFWDIYKATLYAPKGYWSPNQPFALSIYYLRSFEGKDIADESIKQMEHIGFTKKSDLDRWYKIMLKKFPDVNKGTTLTAIRTKKGNIIFYQGSQKIALIKDKLFAKWFLNIWLSPKTSEPSLRVNLLGINPQ